MGKRIVLFVATFLVIYTVNFFLPRLMPGDPFAYTSAVSGEDDAGRSEQELARLRAYYGLNRPVHEQFFTTVGRNLRGDLGESILYKKDVAAVLWERLPWTLGIMFSALTLALGLGCLTAYWSLRRSRLDRALYTAFSLLGELPAFLIGVLLLFLVAAGTGAFPLSGGYTPFAEYPNGWARIRDYLHHAVLPLTALTLATLPAFYFTARAAFLEVLGRRYLVTARSKGLSPGRIRRRYLIRNAAGPIAARFFLSVGTATGGAILVENVFGYPGLGKVMRDAVLYRDYPMIQGVFLLATVLVLASLFVADVLGARRKRRLGL